MSNNATCFDKQASQNGPSLFQNGNLVIQAHHVGWIITGFFTIVATITSFWLVNKHLQWYTNKKEQRYIVRLLFMVPIYAVISFASYLFWNHSTPLLLVRDGYESTVLSAFFYLILTYLSPNTDEQRAIFMKVGLSRQADIEARSKGQQLKKWMFPLSFIKWKPEDGLYFLQLMKWGVLQYCVIRPTTTLAAVILNFDGLYCDSSWGFGWGHVYITVIVSISVTVAMYCLIQLYMPVSTYLAPQKPLLKLFAVKAVVFLTFWQATFLSVLSMFGVVKDTKYMTADDINIGIGALLETFEMMLFAFLHIKAFTYKPYRPVPSQNPVRTPRLRSLGHAMDFRETFREIWIGCIYILDRMRGREPTPDRGARRVAHLEAALGKTRPSRFGAELGDAKDEKLATIAVEVEVEQRVDVSGERQWLGVGDDYGYGLGYPRREKSDGLEEQIERELQRRGYGSHIPGRGHIGAPPDRTVDTQVYGHHPQRSWWRSIYNRVSQSGPPVDEEERAPAIPKPKTHKSKSRHQQRSVNEERPDRFTFEYDYDFDEPPPQSIIQTYRSQHFSKELIPSATEQRASHEVSPSVSNDIQSDRRSHPLTVSPDATSFPLVTLIQPSTSTPEIRNTNSSQPGPSTLSPPDGFTRSDSLLGRVFPYTSSTSHDCPTDSGHSMLSVSRDGCTPAKATPRARLTPSTPLIIGDRMAGERSTPMAADPQVSSPHSLAAELIVQSPTARVSDDLLPSTSSHRRESAQYHPDVTRHSPAPYDQPNVTDSHQEHVPGEARLPGRGNDPSRGPMRSNLRRSSAQTYDATSRRPRTRVYSNPMSHPDNMAANPKPLQPAYNCPRERRRLSAPMDSIPQRSVPIPNPSRNRHSVDSLASEVYEDAGLLSRYPNITANRHSHVQQRLTRGPTRHEMLRSLAQPVPLLTDRRAGPMPANRGPNPRRARYPNLTVPQPLGVTEHPIPIPARQRGPERRN